MRTGDEWRELAKQRDLDDGDLIALAHPASIPPCSSASRTAVTHGQDRVLAEHEVLVLQFDRFEAMLFEGKKRRWSKRAVNARRIVVEIVPTILVRGYSALKLGSAYIANELSITEVEARDAKQLLRAQKVIRLREQSRKGTSVAIWSIHPSLLIVEDRHFARLSQLRWHWTESLGHDRGDRLWAHCYENSDPRRTPRKLIRFSRSLSEHEWDELLGGTGAWPTVCGQPPS